MDHQKGFIIGVGCGRRPIEGSSNHSVVVDYRELVVQFVAAGEAWGADALERFG